MTAVATHASIARAEPAVACRVEPLSRDDWRAHLRAFPDASYTHLWEYARAAAQRVGADHEAVAVRNDGALIALAAVRIKCVPFVGGIAYISGGPLTARSGHLRTALAALRDHYTRGRGLVLRILGPTGDPDWCADATEAFTSLGFAPTDASRSYRTILVDTARPLDSIRAGLAQRWRRHLNFAEKQNLAVRVGVSADFVRTLGDLYRPMVDRKGFSTELDWDFYESLAAQLEGDDRFVIHLIEKDSTPISAMLSCTLGDTAVAILNATSPAGRDFRSSYLLHWAMLEHAHRAGARWLDLTGIDRAANPGGAQFKDGVGGVEILAPGPFQSVPDTAKGRATLVIERAYRRLTAVRNRSTPAQPSDADVAAS